MRVGQFWVEGAESMADPWRDPYFFIRPPLSSSTSLCDYNLFKEQLSLFFLFLTHSIAIRTLVTKAMKTFNDIVVGDTFINNDIITAGNSITIIIVADIVMAMIVLVWPVVCVMDEKLTPARLPTTDTHIHPATRS